METTAMHISNRFLLGMGAFGLSFYLSLAAFAVSDHLDKKAEERAQLIEYLNQLPHSYYDARSLSLRVYDQRDTREIVR